MRVEREIITVDQSPDIVRRITKIFDPGPPPNALCQVCGRMFERHEPSLHIFVWEREPYA